MVIPIHVELVDTLQTKLFFATNNEVKISTDTNKFVPITDNATVSQALKMNREPQLLTMEKETQTNSMLHHSKNVGDSIWLIN